MISYGTVLKLVRWTSSGISSGPPGVHTGNCAAQLVHPLDKAPVGAVPVLEGRQIDRYRCDSPNKALRLDYKPGPGEYFTIRPDFKEMTFSEGGPKGWFAVVRRA